MSGPEIIPMCPLFDFIVLVRKSFRESSEGRCLRRPGITRRYPKNCVEGCWKLPDPG
jgi:hypothetical protein